MLHNSDDIKEEMVAFDERRFPLAFELLGIRILDYDKRFVAHVQGVIGL